MNLATAHGAASTPPEGVSDDERRFGGLRRLYGTTAYDRLRHLHVAVVGVGGVGSWVAEALARSGVARLTLVDMDHVAESNINRQIQATSTTLGQNKVEALRERIALIHPGCSVDAVDDFVTADNWPLAPADAAQVIVDACDDARAKLALASWALREHRALVIAGAAGGKRHPERVERADLVEVTHDPLLAGLRQRLRKAGLLPASPTKGPPHLSGLLCVFTREAVSTPLDAQCDVPGSTDGSLNCHGYGSSVMVTASVGLAAAACAVELGVVPQFDCNRP